MFVFRMNVSTAVVQNVDNIIHRFIYGKSNSNDDKDPGKFSMNVFSETIWPAGIKICNTPCC